ncbi:hypothetical protein FD737_12845 [Pantoea sp. Seng]|uniref:hypothetical protein n=1 Tax=Pantoea sp. Seng TaxID=2576761 RepID=UPI00132A771A|nr:hypothetical protein [Pantoea sp. Seng]
MFISHRDSQTDFLSSHNCAWVIEMRASEISNECWLLGVGGEFELYNITLLPSHKISFTIKGGNFNCGDDEVTISRKVICTLNHKI